MSYKPIESYGVIGDMHTAALVGMDGSIDWLCLPHFDSPSVFAAILDHKKGGSFRIAPAEEGTHNKQFYWAETNVLITRFSSHDGVGQITDFMPVSSREEEPDDHCLIRYVEVARGSMMFRLRCAPAFNYARETHETIIETGKAVFRSKELLLELTSRVPFQRDGDAAQAEFVLEEGQRAVFVLRRIVSGRNDGRVLSDAEGYAQLKETVIYWHRWLSHCTYEGRWREIVHRSALALKLLTFKPTGAIIAAPTCSLPEKLGGHRNWDYRYTWIRDAAFTLYALIRIGMTEEASRFMGWLGLRCHELKLGIPLQPMYGIDGRHDLTEETLAHLEGYRGSGPVRVGNGAYNQLQLDIYGELMDSVYLYNKYVSPISYELWSQLRYLVNWVCNEWRTADEGIWEVRTGRQHFVHSKVMCWVALDRAMRLADKRSFPADRERWLRVRDQMYEEIMDKGWSAKRQSFSRAYGSDALDAANLMMPLVFFVSADDPRMLKSIDAIAASPGKGGLLSDSLLYRYDRKTQEGLTGAEGSFNICTFWLVEALTRAGRTEPHRLEMARLIFEKMLCYANHLGLYAEEMGPRGEALGNFPQAFTHLALISAAVNLDRSLGAGK